MSEHLKFNTDFLDKDTPKKSDADSRTKSLSEKKYNWKKILIISGVVLFFGWIIFSDDNSTSNSNMGSDSPPASANDDSVVVGEYTCSKYHFNQAVALDPDEAESQMTVAQNSLEYQVNALERFQNEIESSYVNEYSSQWEINQHNEKVDEYNSKLSAYKRDAANLDVRINRYNTQVEAHNNYLRNNCTFNR